MTISIIQLDNQNCRMIKVLTNPLEVYVAMREEWQSKGAHTCVSVEGIVDIEAQTINDVPIQSVYAQHGNPASPFIANWATIGDA